MTKKLSLHQLWNCLWSTHLAFSLLLDQHKIYTHLPNFSTYFFNCQLYHWGGKYTIHIHMGASLYKSKLSSAMASYPLYAPFWPIFIFILYLYYVGPTLFFCSTCKFLFFFVFLSALRACWCCTFCSLPFLTVPTKFNLDLFTF